MIKLRHTGYIPLFVYPRLPKNQILFFRNSMLMIHQSTLHNHGPDVHHEQRWHSVTCYIQCGCWEKPK